MATLSSCRWSCSRGESRSRSFFAANRRLRRGHEQPRPGHRLGDRSRLQAKGILHRDVKPSNIFLAHDCGTVVPKLLDLGAGKDVDGGDENTSTGLAIGSPHYMAPEQAAGRKDLDGRVDEYSRHPRVPAPDRRDLRTTIPGTCSRRSCPVHRTDCSGRFQPTIPPNLEWVVLKAMARAREDRYPTLQDFLTALHAATMQAMSAVPIVPPLRNLPTVPRASMPGPYASLPTMPPGSRTLAADPSGTVQTGVSSARSRSSMIPGGHRHRGGHPDGRRRRDRLAWPVRAPRDDVGLEGSPSTSAAHGRRERPRSRPPPRPRPRRPRRRRSRRPPASPFRLRQARRSPP